MSDTKIHPTAIVAPQAEIGEGCEIGPYSVVGEHVKLGAGCRLHAHAVVQGHTGLGDECEVFPFAAVGTIGQDLKYKGDVTYVAIGCRTKIREYATVHLATEHNNVTRIGDDCLIQAYCHVAHECVLGNRIVMSSGAMLSGHAEIDDGAIIGGMTGVVQFVKVGTLAFVGGYCKLTQDVLPFCIADGIPGETRAVNKIGMDRNGRSRDAIRTVTQAYKKIFRAGLSLEKAMEELTEEFPQSPEIATIQAFLARGSKGLARPRAS